MSAREFSTLVNPFFLFRESLQMAFQEYDLVTQGARVTENLVSKPDAKKLSKIVSRQWGKQPAPVRRGWKRQAEHNKLRRERKKGVEVGNKYEDSELDKSESDLESLWSEVTGDASETEWRKTGTLSLSSNGSNILI